LYIPTNFNDFNDVVYVTEGIVDTFSLLSLGINSVALMDAGLKKIGLDFKDDPRASQLDVLKGLNIVLMLDNDNPGFKAKETLMKYMVENNFIVSRKNIKDVADVYDIGGYVKDPNVLLQKMKDRGAYDNRPQ